MPSVTGPVRFGQYTVLKRLAFGGMAEVFLARLEGADGFAKDVVIKRVLPQHNSDLEFVSMFRDEARITAELRHGNIVQVIEFGLDGDQHYLVLEYVDGPSLALVLNVLEQRDARLSVQEAAHITVEVARALDYAHRKKNKNGVPLAIVHRDVSPTNVLISSEGEVKLADFGVARARARVNPSTTASGIFKGKLAYTPPEVFSNLKQDARGDLFALGVIAYEMLTGRRPFAAESEAAIVARLLSESPVPPSRIRPDVPEEFERLVLAMLEKDPAERPARGLVVAEALQALASSSDEPPTERLARTVSAILPAALARQTDRPGHRERPRVLVVDHSRTVRELLKVKLSSFVVVEAASAADAETAVRQAAPSAVLCERSLPDASGLQLCAELRALPALKNVPFVLIVADLEPGLERRAAASGAQAVLPKSIKARDLEETLTRLLATHVD
jgi:serine/threonine protein kinase